MLHVIRIIIVPKLTIVSEADDHIVGLWDFVGVTMHGPMGANVSNDFPNQLA
jgi:hypothetical protein